MNHTGRVKHWNPSRGFGFVRPDNDDTDVFLHVSVVQECDLPDPAVGTRYAFDVGLDASGRRIVTKVGPVAADGPPDG